MTKEPWDYDYHSHRVILNVGRNSFYRGRRKSIDVGILNRPRLVVLIIVITILFILFLKEARTVLASNPHFLVQDIVLENTGLIDKGMIYDILNLDEPIGLFSVSTDKIARLLEKDPDIEKAVVEKILPGTIKITIKERSAYAKLDIDGKRYYIDRNGRVLFRQREDVSIPIIYGLKIDNPMPGELCNTPELDCILTILQTGQEVGWDRFIEPVEVRKSGDSILINTRERILVKLKMADIKEQLDRLIFVLGDVQRKGRVVKIVDLRFRDVYVE